MLNKKKKKEEKKERRQEGRKEARQGRERKCKWKYRVNSRKKGGRQQGEGKCDEGGIEEE